MWKKCIIVLALCTQWSEVYSASLHLNRLWPLENSENDNYDKKPFQPFSDVGVPILRPDGTTKTREPVDTLLTEGLPGFEEGFTSLDNHLKEKEQLGENPKKNVGNLHPHEVYYADDDLLIIKGGGFNQPNFEEPNQDIQPPQRPQIPAQFNPQPPNVHDEYNGNIPTIVEAPPHLQEHNALQALPSQPLSLFVPARYFPRGPYYYTLAPFSLRLRYYLPIPPITYWTYPWQNYAYRPPSLIDDTRVNFVEPLPQINPDAEIVNVQSKSAPSNHNRHREQLVPKPKLSKPKL